jgi:hypothetical protein
MNIQNDVIGLVLREKCKSKQVTVEIDCLHRLSNELSEVSPTVEGTL